MKNLFKGADVKTEAVAGITTFLTMAYIVVVNPAILSTQGTGMSFNGVLTATVLICSLMTLLMGLYAKLPFAVAPGMGLNAFFTFTIIMGQQVPWPIALGMVFWSGVLFMILSVSSVREAIARAIPHELRIGAACGIGVFLSFIGLKSSGFIVSDPVTFVKFGNIGPEILLAIAGLGLTCFLMRKKNPFAFLAGISMITVGALIFGLIETPKNMVSAPDFKSVFLKADILGALKFIYIPAIITLLFTDLFDSISTFVGVSQAANMLDKDGNPKNLRKGLIVDALATLGSGLAGTSSGTTYIESAAGIEAGGRTGLTSVFTALCFLPCLFLAPLAGMVPAYATAPVLVLVGALMFRSITQLKHTTLENIVPAYLTTILIPLTFSITQGILWGFVSYVGLHVLAGKYKKVSSMLYALAGLSVILLVIEHSR
ncbi:NCS2 family permease [Elusimicrobiota bacterium]